MSAKLYNQFATTHVANFFILIKKEIKYNEKRKYMTVKEAIEKRFTNKVYKDGTKMSEEQIEAMKQAASLSPSSNDLQNTRVLALTTKESKELYKPYFEEFNAAILDGAQVIYIFIGNPWNNYKKDNGKYFIEAAMNGRDQSMEVKEQYKDQVFAYYDHVSEYSNESDIVDSTIQCSFMVLQAESMGFNTTIMGGIKKTEMEKFMLEQGTLKPGERVNLALGIGYTDPSAKRNIEHKRYRIAVDKIYKEI